MIIGTSLLVGIGSSVGDDAVGWALAQRLGRWELPPGMRICIASSPVDLLGWLEGVDRLVICDALVGAPESGRLIFWRWPVPEVELERFWGSHDMTLPGVLELAAVLGQLPGDVRLVGVPIASPPAIRGDAGDSPLSDSLQQSLPMLERELLDQLWRWHRGDGGPEQAAGDSVQ